MFVLHRQAQKQNTQNSNNRAYYSKSVEFFLENDHRYQHGKYHGTAIGDRIIDHTVKLARQGQIYYGIKADHET